MAENIHGRIWGRGLRPWFLIPKYISVALIIGGLWAMCVLAIAGAMLPETAAGRDVLWYLIPKVFWFQIIPATVLTVLLGIGLLLQHPRAFLRMRWIWLKLAAVALLVPLSHWYLSNSIKAFGEARLSLGLLIPPLVTALIGFIAIAVIGRLKPRLGQTYGKVAESDEATERRSDEGTIA